jgi:hypothetical protein
MRVPRRVEGVFQLSAGGPRRLAQIRARLLHETSEREGGKAQALGVKLQDGLAQALALVQRLSDDRTRRFGFELSADIIEQRHQRGFVAIRHENGRILTRFNTVQTLIGV